MNRTNVQADDLFFYDRAGDIPNSRSKFTESGSEESEESEDFENELENLNLSSDSESSSCGSSTSSSCSSGSDDDYDEEEEENLLLELPEHACVYCNVHDPLCVAKCTKCSKWFCNSTKGSVTAHIVNHLIKSGHKEVSLHPDSPVGDATLECYNCGCKNLFLLGYVQSKDSSVVVLLCRQPCAFNSPKDSDWDIESWSPLIGDRRLLPWLCQFPSEFQEARARKIGYDKIQKLENAWKSGQVHATIEDLDRKEQEDILESTKAEYADAFEFKDVMMPLIMAEAKIEKDLKEAQVNNIITINYFIYVFRN